jgi:hypothetical protein
MQKCEHGTTHFRPLASEAEAAVVLGPLVPA